MSIFLLHFSIISGHRERLIRESWTILRLQLVSGVFAEMLWFWFNCFDGYPNPAGPRAGSLAHLPALVVSPPPRRGHIGSEKGLFCSGSDGNQSKVVQIAWEILRWTISTYIYYLGCVYVFSDFLLKHLKIIQAELGRWSTRDSLNNLFGIIMLDGIY